MTDRIREALQRVLSFFRRDAMDRELDEEMASHIEMAVDENVKKGMTEQEARRQALVS